MILKEHKGNLPGTIEEWISIHGEPDYEDFYTGIDDSYRVKIVDCQPTPYEDEEDCIGLDKCVYETDKGVKRINYANMSTAIAKANKCIYHKGVFYTPDGSITAEFMRQEITACLESAGWTDKLDAPTTSILNTVRDKFNQETFNADMTIIPFKNGDLHIDGEQWEFRSGEKVHVPYRLNVDFIEEDLPMPWFSKWLHDVFVQDDIVTIQELLGYCLVPTTAAQEAFILVGEAGVGKSILTYLLSEIFGNAYQEVSIGELAANRFILPIVENRLVIYDDDLQTEALTETGIFKKLVTASQPIKAERKYEQPYNFLPYCTIIANSNSMIQTLYDDSDGFYRRLHPLHVKDKEAGRRNISNMPQLVANEKEQIVRWALKGLVRVEKNKWRIHWSERSKDFMGAEKSKGMHFNEFFDIVLEKIPDGVTTSKQLYDAYKRWARANGIREVSAQRLYNWIGANQEKLKVTKTSIGEKRLKGYVGCKIREEWSQGVVL